MYSPQRSVVFADSPVTVQVSNRVIRFNATGGAMVANLPPAASAVGRTFIFVKTDASANALTVTPNGAETINGAATFLVSNQYQVVALFSDGTNWFVAYGVPAGGGGGGSSDFEFGLSGTLSTVQNNLILPKTKRSNVDVNRLDVELQEASSGDDVEVEFFSGVSSLGVVTVTAGALSGTTVIAATIPANTRVTMVFNKVGSVVPGTTAYGAVRAA